MLPILILGAMTVGVVCGRLYSIMAMFLTAPLLAMVGSVVAIRLGWGLGAALATGAAAMLVSQIAFLVGARLRLGRGAARPPRPIGTGKPGQALPSKTTTV